MKTQMDLALHQISVEKTDLENYTKALGGSLEGGYSSTALAHLVELRLHFLPISIQK
jgi:hypothetical protein